VGGGYVLAREPDAITLGDIVSAVDGPIVVGDFGEPHQNGACDHEGQCVLLAVWADVADKIATISTRSRWPTSSRAPAATQPPLSPLCSEPVRARPTDYPARWEADVVLSD